MTLRWLIYCPCGSEVKKHLDLEIKLLLKRQENCTKTISLTLFVVTKFFVTLVNFFRGDIHYQDT